MNPFDYNDKPTDQMVEHMLKSRQAFKALADIILEIPNGRERALALTNLEQASMWANKATTHVKSEVA